MRIKTLTAFLVSLTLAFSCSSYDDSDINNRMDEFDARLTELESYVEHINSNIGSLITAIDALKNGDLIESVTALADGTGYSIVFSKSGEIIVYNGKDGYNGQTPVISVKLDDDGTYYWTVNGEYLLDNNGGKIAATAHVSTPQIRVNEGNFEISYNNGITWEVIGSAGQTGSVVFSSVVDSDESVVFTLSDGTTITIPKVQKFSLNITETSYTISAGSTVSIPYTLSAADASTVVEGFGTNGYSVEVELVNETSGNIKVTAPNPLVDGKIFIFAIDGNGTTTAKVLAFEGGVFTVDDTSAPAKMPAEGGEVVLEVTTNISYSVTISSNANSWISYSIVPVTRAVRYEQIVLTVSPNSTTEERSGEVTIRNAATDELLKTLTIIQSVIDKPKGDEGFPINDWENDGTIKL